MKCRLLIAVLALFLVFGCAQNLPDVPPPPGSDVFAGRAVGMVPPTKLPTWARQIQFTDIAPIPVKYGDDLTVIVEKPSSMDGPLYIYSVLYVFNRKVGFWERANVIRRHSGDIVENWAINKAVFRIPIVEERYPGGENYIAMYACRDTGEVGSNNKKIFNCYGNDYGLGYFTVLAEQYPTILIEDDIGNNRFIDSELIDTSWGPKYTAYYQDLSGIKTDVSVFDLDDIDDFEDALLQQGITNLKNAWTTRGQVCGFLTTTSDAVEFAWLSDDEYWVRVTTHSTIIDDAKIGVYGIEYPPDCTILDTLVQRRKILPGVCGNDQLEAGEACDKNQDAACRNLCKTDCTCAKKGPNNKGFCGDKKINRPNFAGVNEQCEPPGKRDPVTGQLISQECHIRNAQGRVVGKGGCDDKCACIKTAFVKAVCGDGKVQPGEVCGEPGLKCPADSTCDKCKCIPIPKPVCGNMNIEGAEDCDPPGVTCPRIVKNVWDSRMCDISDVTDCINLKACESGFAPGDACENEGEACVMATAMGHKFTCKKKCFDPICSKACKCDPEGAQEVDCESLIPFPIVIQPVEPVELPCKDPDGLDEFTAGTTTIEINGVKRTAYDTCLDEYTVTEYSCELEQVVSNPITCEYGCENDKCNELPPEGIIGTPWSAEIKWLWKDMGACTGAVCPSATCPVLIVGNECKDWKDQVGVTRCKGYDVTGGTMVYECVEEAIVNPIGVTGFATYPTGYVMDNSPLQSRSSQIFVVIIASLAILAITLFTVLHKD